MTGAVIVITSLNSGVHRMATLTLVSLRDDWSWVVQTPKGKNERIEHLASDSTTGLE